MALATPYAGGAQCCYQVQVDRIRSLQCQEAPLGRRAIRSPRSACALLAFLAVLSLVGTACGSRSDHPTRVQLRRGIGGDPATVDPAKAIDTFSFEIIRDLYEGLVSETPDGSIAPGVAEDWSIDDSGTIYRFKLRPTARWSNGERVRASDFVKSWRRVVNPAQASPVADLLRPIANAADIIGGRAQPELLGVTALQDDVLVVRLQHPAPFFPQVLTHSATFPVFPRSPVEATDVKNWVSNGPYVLSSWVPGSKLSLSENSFYWNKSAVRIKSVEYIPLSDEHSELRLYQAGQLDITQNVPIGSIPTIRKEIPNELFVAPYLGVAYYAINLRATGPLQNRNLRQALSMAIDRSKLKEVLLSYGQTAAYGFVPPGTWNYAPQSWAWKNLGEKDRTAAARRLYEESGFANSRPLKLRLLFNSNTSIKQVSLAIAAMWRETLGAETELIEEEYRVFLDSRKDPMRWDIARLGWAADYNDASSFLDTFRKDSPNNDSGYSNAAYETALDAASSTADTSQRRKYLENAEKVMLDDYVVIPIYFYCTKRLIKPYIVGVKANPLGRLYSKHLDFWAN